MKENSVRWFEIYVQDMKRAKSFYEKMLGIKLEKLQEDMGPELEEMQIFPHEQGKPGAAGALVKMKGFPPGSNSTIVYFGSEDCAVEVGRVKDAGGKVFKDKFSIGPHGFIALVTDPDGNMVGLHSDK